MILAIMTFVPTSRERQPLPGATALPRLAVAGTLTVVLSFGMQGRVCLAPQNEQEVIGGHLHALYTAYLPFCHPIANFADFKTVLDRNWGSASSRHQGGATF